ncbi:MAG: alpha/beta fold hydrolase [bacterium]
MPLNTSAFFFNGGKTGCLLIHGFTGTPVEMLQLGKYLAQNEITVSGIQLKGHGTTPEDLAATNWRDWANSVTDGYEDLTRWCSEIFVVGFSLGGALALFLGATQGGIRGVVSLSGAALIRDWRMFVLPMLRRFIRFIPAGTKTDLTDKDAVSDMVSYDRTPLACVEQVIELTEVVRDLLPRMRAPLLIMHGLRDRTLKPENAKYIYENSGSTEKEIFYLNNSGHGIVVDIQKHTVFERVYDFIKRNSS